jgi:hypothetical protein
MLHDFSVFVENRFTLKQGKMQMQKDSAKIVCP